MKARAPPFERDPGVPAEGVPPRRHCRAPTRPRTSALYGAEAPLERARAHRARAIACPHVLPRAMTPTSSPQCSSPFLRRALGGGEAPLCAQIGANPPTRPRQFHCRGTGVLLGCQLGARWCLASSLTCDFNMIKNYTHDWLLLVAAYHASSRRWGALAPQRKTRRFTGDREFGVATASRCCLGFAIGSIVGAVACPLTNAQRRSQRR